MLGDLPNKRWPVSLACETDALAVNAPANELLRLRNCILAADGVFVVETTHFRKFSTTRSIGDDKATIDHAIEYRLQPLFGEPMTSAGAFSWVVTRATIATVEEHANGVLKALQSLAPVAAMKVNGHLAVGGEVAIQLRNDAGAVVGPVSFEIGTEVIWRRLSRVAFHLTAQKLPIRKVLVG